MAFDQTTRNRLQKFVSDARKLLSEEFTQQLQNTYGLDPITGGIAELSDLPSLSPSEQQTAKLLRDTLEHYLAASHKVDPYADKALVTAALDRIVREQAFTVLNRLAALRMAEARQFVMESISQGYQSKGFQLYQRIAGSALGETGQAYKVYLFSVFDELSSDLAVLFDRYSSQGRLFPRETLLLELLDLINHAELEFLWAEDETVGWIYQYFNSKEERKKMRDESQRPRNSRELAVRNQFFTPRYVVEFLTDNTLGRIWYEMTQGKSTLVDSCQYLVRRPNEIFLDADQKAPAAESEATEELDQKELSQEDLLQQTVYIQHRPLKDPRDIKMLDPACGSMHFGLYAFDLFEKIYLEAWDIEASEGYEKFAASNGEDDTANQKPSLHQSYESKEAFLADVPRLIIEHNIHGVDIDPRAAQIAGLSLWLRAQKSWADNAIKPNQRPQVQRSNIVCAEPMPGETKLLKEFTSQIQPRVLGQLVEEIFEKMRLAGEAGTLLKIEEDIQAAIDEAKSQKDEGGHWEQGGLFGENKWQARSGTRYNFDGDISENFWDEAEFLILSELERYAESASGKGSGQKRLFAADAAKGFAFIDLCRKRFDVVLMNPPFGPPSKSFQKVSKKMGYKGRDLAADFVLRAFSIGTENSISGAITTRTLFFLKGYIDWRESLHGFANGPQVLLDLGFGVLDAAVETSAYTLCKNRESDDGIYLSQLGNHKALEVDPSKLISGATQYVKHYDAFRSIPRVPLCYWAPDTLLNLFTNSNSVGENYGVFSGGNPRDDSRFVRHWMEVRSLKKNEYVHYSKGGEFSPYYYDVHLALNWIDGGRELKVHCQDYREGLGWSPDWKALMMNYHQYFKPGITWPRRTSRLSFRFLPKGCVFGDKSPVITGQSKDPETLLPLMSFLNSSLSEEIINLMVGSTELAQSFEVGIVSSVPAISPMDDSLESKSLEQWGLIKSLDSIKEVSHAFLSFMGGISFSSSFEKCFESLAKHRAVIYDQILENQQVIDSHFYDYVKSNNRNPKLLPEDFVGITKKEFSFNVISYLLGCFFGRWNLKRARAAEWNNHVESPFDELGFTSPGMELNGDAAPGVVEFCADLILEQGGKIWPSDNSWALKILEYLDIRDFNEFLIKPNGFFESHLKMYTQSKRFFPVYWVLQTNSSSYSLCVFYERINEQTLFSCVNDFIDPKLKLIDRDISHLENKKDRSSEDEKTHSNLAALNSEIKDLRDELLQIAKFWKPNFSDGVLITAAPLWRLFQNKPWQKKLRKSWEELELGEHDWSHMAYNFWPERVLKKCHQDRSIAIAHDVEDDLWQEVDVPAAGGKGTKVFWQPKEMTVSEFDAYIQQKIAQG